MARTIAKDHDQKRLRILKAAASVFAREGVARASMSQLAGECGISKANIYHYYDGKEAILFDVLERYLSSLRDRLSSLELDDVSAPNRLYLIVQEVLIAYEGMDDEHKVQQQGISLLQAEQRAVLKGYQREMVKLVADVLYLIEPDIFEGAPKKLHATTMSVFGMLNWFYMWNGDADTKSREHYAALVTSLTLSGIKGL